MSYWADYLEREAQRGTDARLVRAARAVVARLRVMRRPHEEDLISRLVALVVIADELGVGRVCDVTDAVATWAEESGGYAQVRRINSNGTNDLGVCQINSVHGVADEVRLSRVESIRFWMSTLARRRVAAGQHPLADFNAFSSGRYLSKGPYAVEAVRRARAPHPSAWTTHLTITTALETSP